MFYKSGKKVYSSGIITKFITDVGFAFMIMGDGSLGHDNILTLHTQGFSAAENKLICDELNAKFGLHGKVVPHKTKYTVVQFPASDAKTIRALIEPHMLPMFSYKVPR